MPNLLVKETDPNREMLVRFLFYGSPKTRKTWLAGTAAEAGFNVILFDIDHGYHILMSQLSEAAKKRLMVVECRDATDRAEAAIFLGTFLKRKLVWFNEKTRRVITARSQLNSDCIEISIQKHLNANTVLILDSYTALVDSINKRFAIEHNVDLTDPKRVDWDGYAWTGALATYCIGQLTKLPCHIIMIAHKTMYEKRAADGKKIEWSRQQIKSTSGPHAMTVGDKFSDIFVFENVSSAMTKVDTRAGKDKEGGSRLIPPNSYDWNKLQFLDICRMAKIPLPPKDLPYLDFSIPEKIESSLPLGGNPISPKAKPTALAGLSVLEKKPKAKSLI